MDDQNNQNQMPPENTASTPDEITAQTPPSIPPLETESGSPQKSSGPIIGILIIIVLLVVGALYVWQMKQKDVPLGGENYPVLPSPENDTMTQQLENVGTSTNLSDIEDDLETTDFDNLDLELEALLVETQ